MRLNTSEAPKQPPIVLTVRFTVNADTALTSRSSSIGRATGRRRMGPVSPRLGGRAEPRNAACGSAGTPSKEDIQMNVLRLRGIDVDQECARCERCEKQALAAQHFDEAEYDQHDQRRQQREH